MKNKKRKLTTELIFTILLIILLFTSCVSSKWSSKKTYKERVNLFMPLDINKKPVSRCQSVSSNHDIHFLAVDNEVITKLPPRSACPSASVPTPRCAAPPWRTSRPSPRPTTTYNTCKCSQVRPCQLLLYYLMALHIYQVLVLLIQNLFQHSVIAKTYIMQLMHAMVYFAHHIFYVTDHIF